MSSTTSIDTNVLLLLWVEDPSWNTRASEAIQNAAKRGPLCVCGPVFSELLGLPGAKSGGNPNSSGIQIDWKPGEADWHTVGVA